MGTYTPEQLKEIRLVEAEAQAASEKAFDAAIKSLGIKRIAVLDPSDEQALDNARMAAASAYGEFWSDAEANGRIPYGASNDPDLPEEAMLEAE